MAAAKPERIKLIFNPKNLTREQKEYTYQYLLELSSSIPMESVLTLPSVNVEATVRRFKKAKKLTFYERSNILWREIEKQLKEIPEQERKKIRLVHKDVLRLESHEDLNYSILDLDFCGILKEENLPRIISLCAMNKKQRFLLSLNNALRGKGGSEKETRAKANYLTQSLEELGLILEKKATKKYRDSAITMLRTYWLLVRPDKDVAWC